MFSCILLISSINPTPPISTVLTLLTITGFFTTATLALYAGIGFIRDVYHYEDFPIDFVQDFDLTNMRPSQWKELEGLERGNVTAFGLWWEDVFGKEFQSGQGTSQFGKTSKGGLFSEKKFKSVLLSIG